MGPFDHALWLEGHTLGQKETYNKRLVIGPGRVGWRYAILVHVRECLLEDLFVLQLLDDRMALIVPCVPHVPGIPTFLKHFERWKTARGREDGSETPSKLVPVISVLAQHGQPFPFVRPPLLLPHR